jgi:hypothetical protein
MEFRGILQLAEVSPHPNPPPEYQGRGKDAQSANAKPRPDYEGRGKIRWGE